MSSQIRFFVFLLFTLYGISYAGAQTCTYGSIVTEQYASSATGVNYWGGTVDGTKGAPDANPSSIYAANNASYQIVAQYDKTFSAGTKIKITARYYSAYYSGNLVLAFSENGVTYTANTSAIGGFNANGYTTVTYTLPATMTGNYKYIRVRGSDATSLMFIDAIQTSRSDCAMFSGTGYADIATGGGTYGNCVKDGGESGKFLPNTKLFANVVSGSSIIYSAPFDSTGTYRIPVLANGNYTIVITSDKTSTSPVMPKLWSLSSGTGSYNITVSGGTTSSTIPTICLKSCLYGSIIKEAYATSALGVNYWGGTPTGAQGSPDGNPSSIYYIDYQPYETKLTYSETFSAGDDLNITGKFYSSGYTGGIVLAFSVDGVNYTANSPTINGFNATNYDKVTYTVPANLTANYKYIRVRGAATNSLFLLDAIQLYSAQCALYIGSAYNDNGKGGGTYGNCTKDGTENGSGLPYQSLYANFVKDDKVVFSSPLDSNGEYKAPTLVDGLYKVVITNTTTGTTASFPTAWALSSGVGSSNGTYTLSIQGGNKTSPTTVPSFCLKTCKGGTFNQLQYAVSSTGVNYWGAVAVNGATGAPDGIGLNVYTTNSYPVVGTMSATFTGGDVVNVWLRQGPYVYAGYTSGIKMQFSEDGVSYGGLVGPYIATSATSSNKISYTIPSSVTSKYKYIRIVGESANSLLIVDAMQTEHYECAMYSANTFNDNGDGGGTYSNCTIDGTENGTTVPYTKLFANVVLNGQVVSSSALKSDGSYSVPELPNGLYSVVISRFSTGITPSLPATWSFSNGVGFYWITVNSKIVTSPTTIPTICLKTCNSGVIDQLQYADSSAGATTFGGTAVGAKGAPDGIGSNVYNSGTGTQLVTKFSRIFTGGDKLKIWGRNQPGYTDGIVLGFSEDGINYTTNTGVIGGFNNTTYTAIDFTIPSDFPADYKYVRVQGNSASTGIFIDAIQVNNVASLCAMYTGITYNDNGKGGGTFGNCTQDGTEDAVGLPDTALFANVIKSGELIYSAKFTNNSTYSIPVLENGNYTIVITNSATNKAPSLPYLWQASTGILSYSITVSNGAVTSPTTIPKICLRTCQFGTVGLVQYASACAGNAALGGGSTVTGGRGAPDGVPTSLYTTGTTYQNIYTYSDVFTANSTVTITAKQYPGGYTGGVTLAFSVDGTTYSAPVSVAMSSLNSTTYGTVSYTLPANLSNSYKFIRIQGTNTPATTALFIDAVAVSGPVCVLYNASAYNDNGQGGGTYGNCTKDGNEDGRTLPTNLFINLVRGDTTVVYSSALDSLGNYSVPSVPNGTYKVIVSSSATGKTPSFPNLWSMSSGTGSYTITVSGGNVTSPTTIPTFCLKTCSQGIATVDQYAAASNGVTAWGGTVNGGAGAPDATLTPVDGAPNNAKSTNVANSGATNQAFFRYNTVFKGGRTITIRGRQYAGYLGGLRLAFSADSINWTANSPSINGFSSTAYTNVSYTIPSNFLGEYRYIRVQGSDSPNTTLMYIDAISAQTEACAMYNATVFHDNGQGGGTYGNCTKDGTEDGTTLPTPLYANVIQGGAVVTSQKVDASGNYGIPTLANGTYTVLLTNSPTATTSIYPNLWSASATNSYSITVSGGAVTSPTTFPRFCMKTCGIGKTTYSQYATTSVGVTNWGGTVNGGAGAPDATLTPVDGAPNNAKATNIYTTGTSYQAIFNYGFPFRAGGTIKITGRQYAGYTGGIYVAFSKDGISYTANSANISGFNATAYNTISYTLPSDLPSDEFMYIRVQGSDVGGTTLMYLDAIEAPRDICTMYKGTAYNDNGKGGGTYGNCTKDGSEDSSGLPAIFVNVIQSGAVVNSQPLVNGSYSIPELPNGTYTIILSRLASSTTANLPVLWSSSVMSYTITVSGNTVTSPTTIPAFCLRTCNIGQTFLGGNYAATSTGVTNWGGTASGGSGAPDATLTPVDGAANNAKATNIYTTGTTYQAIFNYNTVFKGGSTVKVYGRQQSGYTGGIRLAFSSDGVNWTANSPSIHGFVVAAYTAVSYTIPETLTDEYKFIRIQGSDSLGTTLMFIDAVETQQSVCAMYAGEVYNDFGNGGGTYGNCTKDGAEDGTSIPDELYANIVTGGAVLSSHKLDSVGKYYIPALPNGIYAIVLTRFPTATTSIMPNLWSVPTGNYSITVSGGAVTSPTTIPSFCLKTCKNGQVTVEQFASNSSGVGQSWGGTTPGGGTGVQNSTFLNVYAQDNASYQSIFEYTGSFTAADKITIFGKQYNSSYPGGLLLAFSTDGVTYTSNTTAINGFNPDFYTPSEFEIPSSFSGNYRFIRVRGAQGNTLMNINAIKITRERCVMRDATVYNDNGAGGGTFGNCTLDGSEASSPLPTPLYANIVSGTSIIYSLPVDSATRKYSLPTLPNGSYRVAVSSSITDTVGYISPLWNYGTTTGKYAISVASDTITTPTTLPTLCMTPCFKGNVDLSQYAIASAGINQSWGGVSDGAAGAPNGTFQNVYAQDNASYQFVAEFNDIIKDGYTLAITAKQYPGYTGGLVVAFSLDGVTYSSNSVEINGFNSTDFRTINYTVPFAGEFKFVRVRGALGNSLLYVDAIKSSFQQCALYTGTAYSDAGTGGGTFGNCTRDGSESGSGLPNTQLFANVTSTPFDSTRTITAVTQSSVYGGLTGTPANMTDGNGNTGAGTNPVANSFVSFDLGSVRKINYVDLMVHTTYGTGYIAGDIIQWSSNGTTWTDIATLTSSQFTSGAYTNFRFKAVDARYVRVLSPAANYVFLGDVRIKYFNDGFEASAKFEADGTYKIPQLADGTYKIVFTNTNTDTVSRMPQTWSTTMPSYNITVSNGVVTSPTTIPDVCFKPCQIGVVTVAQYAASSTGVNQSWGGTANGAAGETDGKFQNVYAQDNASYETVLKFNKDIVAGDVLNIVAKWVNTSNTKGLVVAFSSDGVSYTANSREINGFNDQLFTSTSYTIPATYTGTYRFIRVRGAQANSLLNVDAIQAVHKECAMYIGQSYDDNGTGGGTYGNCTQDGVESGSTLPTTQLYVNVLNTPFDSTRTLTAVTQSSVYGGLTGTPANMTDGNGNTGAGTNPVANSFVSFDMGSVRKINYVDLMIHTTYGTGYIAGDIIQWSSDGTTWNNIATLTAAQFTAGVYTNFRFPAVDARYVRVLSPAANYVFLGDVRIKYFNDGYVFSAPVESDGTYNIPFLANGTYKVVMATSVTDTVNTLPDLWLNSSGNGTYNITVSNGAVTSPTTLPKFCLKTCERGSLNFDQFASSCTGVTNWGGTVTGGAGAPDGTGTNVYGQDNVTYQAVLTYDKSFKGGTKLKITGRWYDAATYNRGIVLAFSTDGVNYTANSPEINGFGYESATKYYTVDYVIPSSFTSDYKYIRVRGATNNTILFLDAIKVDKSYCKLYTGGAYNDAGTGGGTYGNCTKDGVEEGGSLPNSKLYANVISPNAIDSTYTISAVTYSSLYTAPFTPTVSNLTDKSSTTGGATNATANSWISVDLGGSRTINYIDLMNVSTSPFNNSYMNNLQLQWSNDNTTWTTITTLATASFTDNVYSNYTFPSVTARYVRVLNPSGYTTLGDIRIKNFYDGILASAPLKSDGTYDIPNSFPDGNYKVIITNSPGNNTTSLPDGWSTSLSSFNITTSSGNVTSPTTIPEFCLKFCQYGQIDLSQYSFSATTTNPNWGATATGATGAPDGASGSVYALNNASYQVYMRYADVFTGGQTLNITAKQYPGYTGGLLLEFSTDSINFTTSNMVVNGFTSADFTTISATIPASLTGSYKYIRVRGASASTLSYIDAIQVGRKECAMYKGIVFNDNGKDGGTYGNCVQDGLEDGTSLPSTQLYANVVSSGSVIYSAPVDKFGEYLIPSSLANGSYIIVLALDKTATSPSLPYLWNYSSGNGSYTLNVSGGTNTSTVPKFCLKTCRYQTLDFSTYAVISSGPTNWGGVANGASGEPDASFTNVYSTGTTYQTVTQFNDSVTGGDIINIWGKWYSAGYFDGITVSFSNNGTTWTANSPTLNGMNANSYTKISYRLPLSLTGTYKYIRIQGVSGNTLTYIDAVQMEHYICQQLNPSVYLDNGEGGGTKDNCTKDGSESGFFTIPGRVFVNAINGGNVVRSFPVSYANGIAEVYGLPDATYTFILANSDTSKTTSYPYGYTSKYTPATITIANGEISNPSILPFYICLNMKDYDGDGIADPLDLDLDNDGVLNTTEYTCSDSNYVTGLVTNNVDGLYTASARFRFGTDSARFTYRTTAFANSNQLNATSNSGVHVSCYDLALPFTEQYTMVTDQNLRYNGRITWGPKVRTNTTSGVGNNVLQHQVQVTWSPGNILAKVVDPLGQTNMNDGEFIKSGKVFTQFAGTSTSRTWYLEFYTDNISANFDLIVKHTGTGATWYSYGMNMSKGMCRSRNTDNDTLTNEFDYDSDNDACSDAFESAATGSQVSNYKFGNDVGSNGYFDNLENTADDATPNFEVTYSKAINNAIKECSSLDCIMVNPRLTYRLPQVDPAIASLNCGAAVNVGSLSPGVAASGVSSTISYTGGNGTAYIAQTANSTGVTGLTASLSAGNFTTSTGTLTYNITGTPSGSGAAIFAINIGGQSCTLNRAVSTFSLAGQGFETATGCILNGSTTAANALFPSVYIVYNSPVSGTAAIDVLGNCNSTYGTAMFGSKYVAISRGDAFTIDLGSNLTAGSTFTMTMYERLNTSLSSTPTSYRVGVSTTAGATSASNNLFSTTGTTNTTWTPKTISFTVPAGTSWRYITIEATNTSGTPATLLDF